QDKGLQLLRPSTTGCDSQALTVAPGAEQDQPTRFQQLHEWLSPAVPTGFDVQLDGTGTFNLWTQTVNGASYNGEVCVWIFVQGTDGTRTAAANTALNGASYFVYQQSVW